jgi:hypothetical protein
MQLYWLIHPPVLCDLPHVYILLSFISLLCYLLPRYIIRTQTCLFLFWPSSLLHYCSPYTRNVEHVPKKTSGIKETHPKRVAIWAAASKVRGNDVHALWSSHLAILWPRHGVTGFNVCTAELQSLLWSRPSFLCSHSSFLDLVCM